MDLRIEDRIPHDVLLLMETSVDELVAPESEEVSRFRRSLRSYRDHVGTPGEPDHRRSLAEAYVGLVTRQHEPLLDRGQREAIERCARGFPYAPQP